MSPDGVPAYPVRLEGIPARFVGPPPGLASPAPGVRARPEPADGPRLTVAAAARRLGIAPATLRTWDRRYGIGPGEHVPGRHRRYSADDVARLELMQHALLRGASAAEAARYARDTRLPRPHTDRPHPVRTSAAGPQSDGGAESGGPVLLADDGHAAARVRVGGRVLRLPGAGRAARGLGRAAPALDAGTVRRMLHDSLDAHGVEFTWDEVARPVLAAVSQRWADTGAGVEIEHLISDCVIGVFGMHATTAPPPLNPRPVLLAGAPGELHTLPLVALSTALAQARVECRSLGANLPAVALTAAIRRTAPAAVVVWSQSPATADADLLGTLPRTRPQFRTFVAGPGWTGVALPPRIVGLTSLADAGRALSDAVLP